jgi:integrase
VRAVRARLADGTVATYWYCRLTGARLPDIADPGFADALAAARRLPGQTHAEGTLGALLIAWRRSQEWEQTAPSTKAGRNRYLAAIETPELLPRRVVDLPDAEFRKLRVDLLELRDAIATDRGRGAASVFGQAIGSLFAWAVARGRLVASPFTRTGTLDGGRIPPWTEADARHAMATWPEPERRAVVLNYHLGQRRGDLIGLRWKDYDVGAGVIRLQPRKTARRREAKGIGPLRLIVPAELAWELRRWRGDAGDDATILTRADGGAWSGGSLAMAISRRLRAEGWPTKRGLHGLRSLRAQSLAEHGASDHEIQAAQGWDSARSVRTYTAGADQERMARQAVDRLSKPLAKAVK